MSGRTFAAAVATLDRLIPKRPPVAAVFGATPTPSPAQKTNIDGMQEGMQCLGLTQDDMDEMKVVHIAGTKGKGSTAAMCESVLRRHGLKTGLFTSPHLISITERIRLNGAPISEESFARYFWEVWDKLGTDEPLQPEEAVPKTTFFRFITLLALYAFKQERPDVVILEVGLGGRLDSTNQVAHPWVCGISHIGYDHVEVLGNTLTLIAAEKAGICKPGVPCIIAPNQEPEAQACIERVAADIGAPLVTAPKLSLYGEEIQVGLCGEHQKDNAALALGLCQTWLQRREGGSGLAGLPCPLSKSTLEGLAVCSWPGRCQKLSLNGGKLRLMLDGAHTDHSIAVAIKWYQSVIEASPQTSRSVCMFYCMPNRPVDKLLAPFTDELGLFSTMHFTPTISSKVTVHTSDDLPQETADWLQQESKTWSEMVPSIPSVTHRKLSSCLEALEQESNAVEGGLDVLVTGSLYLVGDVLKLVDSDAAK